MFVSGEIPVKQKMKVQNQKITWKSKFRTLNTLFELKESFTKE